MRKRKISLLTLFAVTAAGAILLFLSGRFARNVIEGEVKKVFPRHSVNSRIEQMEYRFSRGLSAHEVSLSLAGSGDSLEAAMRAKGISARLNLFDVLFRKNVELRSLTVDTLILALPTDLTGLIDGDLSRAVRSIIRRASDKGVISPQYAVHIHTLKIRGTDSTSAYLSELKIRGEQKKYFRVSFMRAGMNSTDAARFCTFRVHGYDPDFLTRDYSSLYEKLQGTLSSRAGLRRAYTDLRRAVYFDTLEMKIGYLQTENIGILNLRGRISEDDTLFTGQGRLSRLEMPDDTLTEGHLVFSHTPGRELCLDELRGSLSRRGSLDLKGEFYPFDDYSSQFSLTLNAFPLRSIPDSLLRAGIVTAEGLRGKLSLRGRFSGYWRHPLDGWFAGTATATGFLLDSAGVQCDSLPFPVQGRSFQVDSLIFDTLVYRDSTLMCRVGETVFDTTVNVPFRRRPPADSLLLNLTEKSLFLNRIREQAVPLAAGDTLFAAARNMYIRLSDSHSSEAFFRGLSADTLRFQLRDPANLYRAREHVADMFEKLLPSEYIHVGRLEYYPDRSSRAGGAAAAFLQGLEFTADSLSRNLAILRAQSDTTHLIDSLHLSFTGDTAGTFHLRRFSVDSISSSDGEVTNFLEEFFLRKGNMNAENELIKLVSSDYLKGFYANHVNLFMKSRTIRGDSLSLQWRNDSVGVLRADLFSAGTDLYLTGARGRCAGLDTNLHFLSVRADTLIADIPDMKRNAGNVRQDVLDRLPRKNTELAYFRLHTGPDTLEGRTLSLQRESDSAVQVRLSNLQGPDGLHGQKVSARVDRSTGALQYGAITGLTLPAFYFALKDSLSPIAGSGENRYVSPRRLRSALQRLEGYREKFLAREFSLKIRGCKLLSADTAWADGIIGTLNLRRDSAGRTVLSCNDIALGDLHLEKIAGTAAFPDDYRRLDLTAWKMVTEDNTRFFLDSGTIGLTQKGAADLHVKVQNFKLSRMEEHFFADSDALIRGGAYLRAHIKGDIADPMSFTGKRLSLTLLNLRVENLPLQKTEKIRKFAPTFGKIRFSKIVMNPVDLHTGGRLHLKYAKGISPKLSFEGWGNLDYRGRFYFEMRGRVKPKHADRLPRLTRLALNEGHQSEYGAFFAKFFGTMKKQRFVPERGIAGRVVKSEFRRIGAAFREIFQ
ncbi:MAG: hypothetical protein ACQEQV_04105 [Fibrobacterota bacterium]